MNKKPFFDEKGRFHHPCCIPNCPHEGVFGEGVFLLKGKLGRWYCAQHWREKQMRAGEKQKQNAPAASPVKAQGSLF